MKRKLRIIIGWVIIVTIIMSVNVCWAEKITLRYQTTEVAPTEMEAWGKIIADFEKLHPNTTVEIAKIAWKDQYPKTMAAFAIRRPPDLIHMDVELIVPFYSFGLMLSVDDVIADIEKEFTFLPGTKQFGIYKGVAYGVPLQVQGEVLWYRKDLVDKKGLTVPETWNDWVEVAKKLMTDLDGDGTIDIYGVGIPAGRNLFTGSLYHLFVAQAGGYILDKEGKVVLYSPEAIEALKFYGKLAESAPPGIGGWSYGEVWGSYVAKTTAMVPYWGRVFYMTHLQSPEVFPYTQNLFMPAHPVTGYRYAINPAECINIAKYAKYPKMAREWIKFILRPENYTIYAHSIFPNFQPAIKETTEYPEFLAHEFFKSHPEAVQTTIENYKYSWASTLEHPELGLNAEVGLVFGEGVMEEIVGKYLFEGYTAEKAVKWGHNKICDILERPQDKV